MDTVIIAAEKTKQKKGGGTRKKKDEANHRYELPPVERKSVEKVYDKKEGG
jgi:hypothetical protein